MSARLPQLDNCFPIGKPFTGIVLALANKGKERVRPKASPDDQPADPVSDVEQAVDAFNFGRHFKQNSRVESIEHSTLPHTLESERGKGAATSGESKAVTGINPHLRPSVKLQRRAVSVTSDSRTPANDNDDWREAEAA